MHKASACAEDVSLFQQSSHRYFNMKIKSIQALKVYSVFYRCIRCHFGPELVHHFTNFCFFREVQ